MIFTYNKEFVGDVLMIVVADNEGKKLDVERKNNVARIFRIDNDETVAWNIFQPSDVLEIRGCGQVFLTDEEIAVLNRKYQLELVNDHSPKFVVGEIVEMRTHPDSDHLNICQVAISKDQTVQIVAGAPNAKVGLKTLWHFQVL